MIKGKMDIFINKKKEYGILKDQGGNLGIIRIQILVIFAKI